MLGLSAEISISPGALRTPRLVDTRSWRYKSDRRLEAKKRRVFTWKAIVSFYLKNVGVLPQNGDGWKTSSFYLTICCFVLAARVLECFTNLPERPSRRPLEPTDVLSTQFFCWNTTCFLVFLLIFYEFQRILSFFAERAFRHKNDALEVQKRLFSSKENATCILCDSPPRLNLHVFLTIFDEFWRWMTKNSRKDHIFPKLAKYVEDSSLFSYRELREIQWNRASPSCFWPFAPPGFCDRDQKKGCQNETTKIDVFVEFPFLPSVGYAKNTRILDGFDVFSIFLSVFVLKIRGLVSTSEIRFPKGPLTREREGIQCFYEFCRVFFEGVPGVSRAFPGTSETRNIGIRSVIREFAIHRNLTWAIRKSYLPCFPFD